MTADLCKCGHPSTSHSFGYGDCGIVIAPGVGATCACKSFQPDLCKCGHSRTGHDNRFGTCYLTGVDECDCESFQPEVRQPAAAPVSVHRETFCDEPCCRDRDIAVGDFPCDQKCCAVPVGDQPDEAATAAAREWYRQAPVGTTIRRAFKAGFLAGWEARNAQ